MTKTLEDRIIKLEETVYFQEKTISELNDALTQQQLQLDEIHKLQQAVEIKLRQMAPLLRDADAGDDGPPPHYL
jgi:SlyX protein